VEFLTYLASEWSTIGRAPLIFISATVLAGIVAYGLARWAYVARLDAAEDRLTLKDEQIADRDRKLAELRRLSESPPPRVEPHGDGIEDYSAVIRQLVQLYVLGHDGLSPALLAGTELPPRDWMNVQLAKMGKGWRVGAVLGPTAEIRAA